MILAIASSKMRVSHINFVIEITLTQMLTIVTLPRVNHVL